MCVCVVLVFFPLHLHVWYLIGGETIRQINQQSGAHVELQKHPGPNPNEKLFNIRGTPDQIQHAMQMISEKAGIPYVSYMKDESYFAHWHGYQILCLRT